MKETGKERAHERVFFIKDISLDDTMSCTSSDICESGLFVNTTQFFKTADMVKVTIPLESEKITLKAEVKYCHQGIGIGIMFVDMDSKQKVKIKEFIESLMK
ncbi:MAG: hypothetical protein A2X59_02175 [Nitrospirae bacterium GWC2_42_7]|nr:MAG: hypothetical protein A2X59_02175 [Nitrospirae bacterium GWC2_42_7]